MDEIKQKFINGQSITGLEFIRLCAAIKYNISKNLIAQIDGKVESIKIIHDNGAAQIKSYRLYTNTLYAIGRAIKEVYNQLKNNK